MAAKVAGKVLELVAVLFLASLGTFMLLALLPGDAAIAVAGPDQPPERYEEVRQELGLNKPVTERYASWLGGALRGDLGRSLVPPGGEVSERVAGALPVSIELAVGGLLVALAIAVPLALLSARRPDGAIDRSVSAFNFGFLSAPSFLVGMLLILVFVKGLGLFPRAQWVRPSDGIRDNLRHAFLPVLAIALPQAAVFTRILRSDLLVTMREPFIEAARAKGMPGRHVLVREALRPSSFSLITLAGVSLGSLIGSTVIVETLFGLPGMGTLIVNAAQQRDVLVVQGAVLVIATIYVLVNAAIDMVYGLLDPRIRRGHH